jgi:hypothetical protein
LLDNQSGNKENDVVLVANHDDSAQRMQVQALKMENEKLVRMKGGLK